MTNDKTTVDSVPVVPAVRGQAAVAESSKPVRDVKVIALSIDENDDFGGDPYNHTGYAQVTKLVMKKFYNEDELTLDALK